jgi:hypothetical protein
MRHTACEQTQAQDVETHKRGSYPNRRAQHIIRGRQVTDWHTGGCSKCVTSPAQSMQAQCYWIRAQQGSAQKRSTKLTAHTPKHTRHTQRVYGRSIAGAAC